MNRIRSMGGALAVLCMILPGRFSGQTSIASSGQWTVPGYLGIENLNCDCTLSFGSGRAIRRFVFRSLPMVMGVAEDSPADGLLESGDVITEISNVSLLTKEGARRFASISPGDDVSLTIRRNGRVMKVALRAGEPANRAMYGVVAPLAPPRQGAIAWTLRAEPAIPPEPVIAATPAPRAVLGPWARAAVAAAPLAPAVPSSPGEPPTPAVPAVLAVPAVPSSPLTPSAWFGFSIRCNDCGWERTDSDTAPVWESAEPPEISMVDDGSPAGRAGLMSGDRIMAIDGLSIQSSAGAHRFGAVQPGQRIRLTVRRGGKTLVKELKLERRPEEIAARAARVPRAIAAPAARRSLRYTGQLDNVSVEVWSPGGPVVEKAGDTMIITVGTSVIRIRVDPKK